MVRYLIEITDQEIEGKGKPFGKKVSEIFALVQEQENIILTGKVILHEYGHLKGLKHCPDQKCIMHFCNTIAELKRVEDYCDKCNMELRDER